MSISGGLLEGALGEAAVTLPPIRPWALLPPPDHRDHIKADGPPAAAHQQGQLHGIFNQIFGSEVTW